MAADQQFCLKWNNHQSTLISVFDTLLESGTLVDCTLAAEGQFMKAHKVVLSACSPYFELLLSQHYDKHPIVVLKDVKFHELKALMDYMYRGEVNISQDQLGSLLKVAESLQIKGLSEGSDEKEVPEKKRKQQPSTPRPRTPPAAQPSVPAVENRKVPQSHSTPIPVAASSPVAPRPVSRDGCPSPIARKRKKLRQPSSDAASFDDDTSNELPPQAQPIPNVSNLPSTVTSVPLSIKPPTPAPPPKIEPEIRPSSRVSQGYTTPTKPAPPAVPIETELVKVESVSTEMLIQPKTEVENEDIEDLTLDDDDEYEDIGDQSLPGPSHSDGGSNQGYENWQMGGDQTQDEVFMAAQEAVGANRDSQGSYLDHVVTEDIQRSTFTCPTDNSTRVSQQPAKTGPYSCPSCERTYKWKESLNRHFREGCNKLLRQCPFCPKKFKQEYSFIFHVKSLHGDKNF